MNNRPPRAFAAEMTPFRQSLATAKLVYEAALDLIRQLGDEELL
jgi:hypothetical protein